MATSSTKSDPYDRAEKKTVESPRVPVELWRTQAALMRLVKRRSVKKSDDVAKMSRNARSVVRIVYSEYLAKARVRSRQHTLGRDHPAVATRDSMRV